jgi:hypothetical protein
MLDVIGAGATAVSNRDWHESWLNSQESKKLTTDIEAIHSEGRSHPPVAATLQSEFATSWAHQTRGLILRGFQSYWRDPTYLMAKLRYLPYFLCFDGYLTVFFDFKVSTYLVASSLVLRFSNRMTQCRERKTSFSWVHSVFSNFQPYLLIVFDRRFSWVLSW